MTLIEAIADLTARTPSGSGFWFGNNYLIVRYGSDSWEWEYRGNLFYDLQDLAEEILRRSGATPSAWAVPARPDPEAARGSQGLNRSGP